MRRLCLVLFSVVSLLQPAGAGAVSPEYPRLAGRTVIHSEGIAGVTMDLRSPTRVFGRDMNVTAAPGTHVVEVVLMDQTPNPELCDFCLHQWVTYYPEFDQLPHTGACGDFQNGEFIENGCSFDPGLVEIYLVSDGPITFTLERSDLAGETEIQATADVEGSLERIPVQCEPSNQCDVFAYGGIAREVGADAQPGYASVVAYEIRTSSGNGTAAPSEGRAVACAYPSDVDPGASTDPDPAAHQYGCDVFPSASDLDSPESALFRTAEFAAPFVSPNGGALRASDASFNTHGLQYLGFAVRQVKTITPAHYDAWGLWLNQGMSCPSGDFANCQSSSV